MCWEVQARKPKFLEILGKTQREYFKPGLKKRGGFALAFQAEDVIVTDKVS